MERRTVAHLLAAVLAVTAVVLVIIGLARWDGKNPLIPADAELAPLPEFEHKPGMKLDAATDAAVEADVDATVTAQFEAAGSTACTDEADSLPDTRGE